MNVFDRTKAKKVFFKLCPFEKFSALCKDFKFRLAFSQAALALP